MIDPIFMRISSARLVRLIKFCCCSSTTNRTEPKVSCARNSQQIHANRQLAAVLFGPKKKHHCFDIQRVMTFLIFTRAATQQAIQSPNEPERNSIHSRLNESKRRFQCIQIEFKEKKRSNEMKVINGMDAQTHFKQTSA